VAEGYVNRILRHDEATLDVVAYIVANPVRAGLCSSPREYSYLGSTVYSMDDLLDAIGSRPNTWRPW
jgi:hypothetical protein